jgi:hypothetical protein
MVFLVHVKVLKVNDSVPDPRFGIYYNPLDVYSTSWLTKIDVQAT